MMMMNVTWECEIGVPVAMPMAVSVPKKEKVVKLKQASGHASFVSIALRLGGTKWTSQRSFLPPTQSEIPNFSFSSYCALFILTKQLNVDDI